VGSTSEVNAAPSDRKAAITFPVDGPFRLLNGAPIAVCRFAKRRSGFVQFACVEGAGWWRAFSCF